ncbi:hypothetical protein IV203_037842 [Nitzschia inconspicua]|uniref:Uncharacterized protein n=1 Tax=Nitzschia inconspicua TaxID=303405 RepID=A0A9K3LLH1_9STRA|nr:hypothetical protein IV203_037842 [Nitzschia inconspicua]
MVGTATTTASADWSGCTGSSFFTMYTRMYPPGALITTLLLFHHACLSCKLCISDSFIDVFTGFLTDSLLETFPKSFVAKVVVDQFSIWKKDGRVCGRSSIDGRSPNILLVFDPKCVANTFSITGTMSLEKLLQSTIVGSTCTLVFALAGQNPRHEFTQIFH